MGVILIATHRGGVEVLRHYLHNEVNVGRSERNELAIPSLMLSRTHCRFVLRDNRDVFVSDASSTSGTWVNEQIIHADEVPITERDTVRIGDWLLRFVRDLEIESGGPDNLHPKERAFLESIAANPQDEATRAVYADWLEDQGDRIAEVELLRIDREVAQPSSTATAWSDHLRENPERAALIDRRIALAEQIQNPTWKCIVVRGPIEGCLSSPKDCPRSWERLTPTDRIQVRRCNGCMKEIYFASTIDEAREWIANRQRVAIDPSGDMLRRRPIS